MFHYLYLKCLLVINSLILMIYMVDFVLGLKELFCRQRGKINALEQKTILEHDISSTFEVHYISPSDQNKLIK